MKGHHCCRMLVRLEWRRSKIKSCYVRLRDPLQHANCTIRCTQNFPRNIGGASSSAGARATHDCERKLLEIRSTVLLSLSLYRTTPSTVYCFTFYGYTLSLEAEREILLMTDVQSRVNLVSRDRESKDEDHVATFSTYCMAHMLASPQIGCWS
jgi:hypothetical protein